MLYLHPLSKTATPLLNDLVAQLVEHFTFNERVPGSSPGQVTSKKSKSHKIALWDFLFFTISFNLME